MPDHSSHDYLDSAPPSVTSEGLGGSDFDLRHYVDVLRRRWWWVLGAGILATSWVWFAQRDVVPVPIYTGEAMVQRVAASDPAGFVSAFAPRTLDVASELRILRTRNVLGAVVDDVGLRLRVTSHPAIQGKIFADVVVAPQAANRAYRLVRQGDRVHILSAGQEVASAAVSSRVLAPGFEFSVIDPAEIPPEGLDFNIISERAAIAALNADLDVGQVDQTTLIRLVYRSLDPILAAAGANAVAVAYQNQAARKRQEEARRTRDFVEARLETVSDSLLAAQERLLDFQAASQSFNPRTEAQSISSQLTTLADERRGLQERERNLTELIVGLQTNEQDALRQLRLFNRDLVPGATELFGRLQRYEENRNELINVRRRTPSSPEIQLLDSLIVETAAEIRLVAEDALRMTGTTIDRLDGRIGDLRRRMGNAPAQDWEFSRLEQRVEAVQRTHDMLTQQLHQAQIAEAVQSSDVQVVDPAIVPDSPSMVGGAKRSLPLTFLMGMLGGAALALVLDRMDTRIRRPEEVRRHAQAEIIGTIPTLRMQRGGGRPLVAHNGAVSSEAFRMLRTNIRFARTDTLRTIAVTSAGPQEGKSIITSNLALAMAQEGKRILLVDADLRRPVLHGMFGMERQPGLSDILVGEPSSDAIKTSLEHGIDVIPAGTSVPNPAELVGSRAFQSFLERAKENYDIVLVDTPPILAVTDASVVASAVDGVVVVVRQDRTHRTALSNAGEQLRRSRASVLGVVVNGVDLGSSRYGRYGRYGYGYGYGYGATEYVEKSSSNGDGEASKGIKLPFVG